MKIGKQSHVTLLATVYGILLTGMIGANAQAGDFKQDHPRRAEVNARVRNERKRIAEGLKSGKLTPAQAKQLEGELNGVKAEEHAEVKSNGGYLTKPEQKQLNQELNQDSRQIYAEKHPAASAATPSN